MTNYRRGYDLERAVCKKKLADGADYAMRAPGSRGPFDVIALYGPGSPLTRMTRVELIQCKTNGKRMDAASRIRLYELAERLHATALVASKGPKGRGIVFEKLGPE